jgi:MFS transporter, DHA1 family, multidrug resistance protein
MKMPGRVEFIAIIASITMLIAFAIDSMLPALPNIGRSLGVANETRWSLVITAFTIGFGIAQLFIGTLSDRFGRRIMMLGSMVVYAGTSLLAAASPSFGLLLFARATQGIGAAGGRVLVQSVVRDRFEGREMAQVMSLAAALFMAAPVVAPFLGTAILHAGLSWHWIFVVLAVIGGFCFVWVAARLPETLHPEFRRPITLVSIVEAARIIVADRQSVGYTIGMLCLTVAIQGFLTTVTLIFTDTFGRDDLLPWGFGIRAGSMMVASLVNARIVMTYGMRLIGHAALIGFTVLAAVHAVVSLSGIETLVLYIVLQSAMMACFSLCAGNFGAMAMEHMGPVAGTASSVQGSFAAVFGAIGGALIAASFDGTTYPLYAGITIVGVVAIAAVMWAEGGRLFVARHVEPKVA